MEAEWNLTYHCIFESRDQKRVTRMIQSLENLPISKIFWAQPSYPIKGKAKKWLDENLGVWHGQIFPYKWSWMHFANLYFSLGTWRAVEGKCCRRHGWLSIALCQSKSGQTIPGWIQPLCGPNQVQHSKMSMTLVWTITQNYNETLMARSWN